MLMKILKILLSLSLATAFTQHIDGPVANKQALIGESVSFECDIATSSSDDQLMLLVWYKENSPIYSYDGRSRNDWISPSYNKSARLKFNRHSRPSVLSIKKLTEEDQAVYHCRVDFLLSPTKNVGINLTVVILPNQPFFLDEYGNKVSGKVGPYHEGDNLVLSCLVIGGKPSPQVQWYSGENLVDATYGPSEVPGIIENELYLPLIREYSARLSCRAKNTDLAKPLTAGLDVELYLPAKSVIITWATGNEGETLRAGEPAVAHCEAKGSYPHPDLTWWLDHKLVTENINHSLSLEDSSASSWLSLSPTRANLGSALSCVATNILMAPSRGSLSNTTTLNVTYPPLAEVMRVDGETSNDIVESSSVHLHCKVDANPPATVVRWFRNNVEITSSFWENVQVTLGNLVIKDISRTNSGSYSCTTRNSLGTAKSQNFDLDVKYPPECRRGAYLTEETLVCDVDSNPPTDTFLWRISAIRPGSETQQLTTSSPKLKLALLTDPLESSLRVSCEAGNGVAIQRMSCQAIVSLVHLRPEQPKQCDMVFEAQQFFVRCDAVSNASHYEVTTWRISASNASLALDARDVVESVGGVRGALGQMSAGDEVGVAACTRYGCSAPLLLRPSSLLLETAYPPWWHVLLEKDIGISVGVAVLLLVLVLCSLLVTRALSQARKRPVIQLVHLDDIAKEYLDNLDQKRSIRSCSSVYSGMSLEEGAPPVDRSRKPLWDLPFSDTPPPDLTAHTMSLHSDHLPRTMSLHRESTV